MPVIRIRDKERIERFLREDPFLHLYALGDLDDFFWPFTTWFALEEEGRIREMALLYTGTGLPVLLAFAREPLDRMRRLLREILPELPVPLYLHLSGDLVDLFGPGGVSPHGEHCRMALLDQARLAGDDSEEQGVRRLAGADLPELLALYRESYPGNWFDPRMLETGFYYGLRREGVLAAVGGVHVYSAAYRVAALGNVTTHPRWRGRGLARTVVRRLCLSLLPTVDHVGLNVKSDNAAAIACYEGLGFRTVARYSEYMLEHREQA